MVTNSVSAASAFGSFGSAGATISRSPKPGLGERDLDHALGRASGCRRRSPSRSSAVRRRAKAPASLAAAAGDLPSTSTPEVSRSSRCTRRGRFEPLAPGGQQPVDVAVGLGAALHGEARRLVQRQHVVVLVEHQAAHERAVAARRAPRAAPSWRRVGQRRHAHLRAGGQPRLGLGARAVDADLAAAGQLLDLDVAQVRPAPPEPAVEPHAVLGVVDGQGAHLGHRLTRRRQLRERRRPRRSSSAAMSAGTGASMVRSPPSGCGKLSDLACSISRGTGRAAQHQRAAVAGVAGDRAADARPGGRAAGACGRCAGRSSISAASSPAASVR